MVDLGALVTGLGERVDDSIDVGVLRDRVTVGDLESQADTTGETPEGPAGTMLADPDGHMILIDQHF